MKSTSKSLKVLKILLFVAWWGTIFFLAAVSVAAGLELFGAETAIEVNLRGSASNLDASSLSVSAKEGGVAALAFVEPVWVDVALSEEFWAAHPSYLVVSTLFALVLAGTALGGISCLRKILDSVERGEAFEAPNAQRLRVLGILILVGTLGNTLMEFVSSAYADVLLRPQGFNFDGRIAFDEGVIVVGLSVLVLSEVFRIGAKLREEQELTI